MEATHLVRVLEVDPDLGARLDARSAEAARRFTVAEVRTSGAGAWEPAAPGSQDGDHLGLLILEGVVARTVTLCDQQGIELFGAGALVNPWSDDGSNGTLEFEETWTALQSTDFAVLDHNFHTTASRWPGIVAELMARALRQSRELALHRAVRGHAGLAQRLHLLLWLLADRWGRVRVDGVEVPIKLSHDLLGRLVGARRPSVSSAMAELAATGVVERGLAGRWVLRGGPPLSMRSESAPAASSPLGSVGDVGWPVAGVAVAPAAPSLALRV